MLKLQQHLYPFLAFEDHHQYWSVHQKKIAGLDRFGHSFSRDQVKTELHWLADQGLVVLENDLGS
ncbi:ArsR family transcriptional regulator, partial [Acinetobacter baumannii]